MSAAKDNSNEDGKHRQPAPSDAKLEAQVEQLLASASTEKPPVDVEFLAELKQQTTEAFLNPIEQATSAPAKNELTDSSLNTPPESINQSKRSRRMLSLVYRVVTVTVVGVISWFALSGSTDNSDPTLGDAFAKAQAADSFQMKLTQASLTLDVLATPEHVRLSGADGNFIIGNSKGTWNINTAAKRVVANPAKYFGDNGKLRLLSLLGDVSAADLATVAKTQPTKKVTFENEECWHYQSTLRCDGHVCGLAAYVQVETGQLRQLELLPTGVNPDRSAATLSIVQWNLPIEESMFAFSEELTPEGRIGRVASVQGLVSYRPPLQRRWSLVSHQLQLETGDQIRTAASGANAVQFKTKQDSVITVGPNSIVELVSADTLRVIDGQLRVAASEKNPITLNGPGDQTIAATDTSFYRVVSKDGKQTLSKIDNQPKWLAGFDGTSNHDPTGSLVASIDGRDVPLTVGYHKVSVDIRDQIARTVVEQSFVNHTNVRLEGVFYFPLPQDASISGFGMWINGELVEADVVEKQRAREIYETILREKRDPGLLEWTGGNIFKARVFPILGNSEKRIKITYTQVLPKKDNRYVYQYGLQSEMLRQNPLRDLSVNVRVHSATELAKVECTTHETRDALTQHSAQIEFAAQNYSPTSDLEVTVDVAGSAPPIAAIPHLRGDNGYLLLQVTPPRQDPSGWQELSGDDSSQNEQPIEFLIVADTSASMNEIARLQQANFIESFVSLLSPEDSVRLVAADVQQEWQSDSSKPGGAETATALRNWLDKRHSLGWSDLTKTFAEVKQQAKPGVQIIYVGDGMTATFDTDVSKFLTKLKQTFTDDTNPIHTVGVGSSFESIALNGLGTLSGGSSRMVSTSLSPQSVAATLLADISQPSIKNLKVEFDGLQVAAVYPTTLPNLADGKQQIILGRYLPEAGDTQPASVKISGTRNGKPVSWTTPLEFEQAEAGNSFIPRLWARKHLDYLLAQGSSPSIQDQVIELSERFHIITPYTSLLVLESDADRARFGVKRRYRMRDGERFFADGRSATDFDLLQAQMRSAGSWRIGLQQQFLRHFATLGETPVASPNNSRHPISVTFFNGSSSSSNENYESDADLFWTGGILRANNDELLDKRSSFWAGDELDQNEMLEGLDFIKKQLGFSDSDFFALPSAHQGEAWAAAKDIRQSSPIPSYYRYNLRSLIEEGRKSSLLLSYSGQISSQQQAQATAYEELEVGDSIQSSTFRNLIQAFPTLRQPAKPFEDIPNTEKWPADVRKFVKDWASNNPPFSESDGGIEVISKSTHYNPLREFVSYQTKQTRLLANKKWLNETSRSGSHTTIDWCGGQQRSHVNEAFQLGRRRTASAAERRHNPLANDFDIFNEVLSSGHQTKLSLSAVEGDLQTLTLKYPAGDSREIEIDIKRWLVLSDVRKDAKDKLTSKTQHGDFVEIGGRWWAQKVTTQTEHGSSSAETQHQIRFLKAAAFDEAFQAIANRTTDFLYFDESIATSLRAAFNSVAQNKATATDHLIRLNWYLHMQNWKRAANEIATLKKLPSSNPIATGLLEVQLLRSSARHEELRLRLLELADKAIATIRPDSDNALALANQLTSQMYVLQQHERLELHRKLKPTSQQSMVPYNAYYNWDNTDASLAQGIEEPAVNLKRRRDLALQRRHQQHVQASYAQHLQQLGLTEQADQWFEAALEQGPNPDNKEYANPLANQWAEHEYYNLLQSYLYHLQGTNRHEAIVDVCERFFADSKIAIPYESPYQAYLKALSYVDAEKETETVHAWLAEITTAQELSENDDKSQEESVAYRMVIARIRAAIYHATKHGYYHGRYEQETRYQKQLIQLAREASRHPQTLELANQFIRNSTFVRGNGYPELQQEFLKRLEEQAAELPPEVIGLLVWNAATPKQGGDFWKGISDKLQTRWLAQIDLLKQAIAKLEAEDSYENEQAKYKQVQRVYAFERSLNAICIKIDAADREKTTDQNQPSAEAQIAFYRLQVQHAWDDAKRLQANRQLFTALLGQKWDQATEDETFQLIAQLMLTENPDLPSSKIKWLDFFNQWVNACKKNRTTGAMAKFKQLPENKPNSSTTTPAERSKNRKAVVDQAFDGLIESLQTKENNDSIPAGLNLFVRMHRHRLELRRNTNLDEARDTGRAILGDKPLAMLPAIETDFESNNHVLLDRNLKNQALLTLLYLSARKSETAENRQWIQQYIRQGIESTKDSITLYRYETPDDKSPNEDKDAQDLATEQAQADKLAAQELENLIANWRTINYQWMIVTDQIDPLLELLQQWAAEDDGVSTWRHALGMLTAERGDVEAAIKHFEQIEVDSHLSAGDYQLLSKWYVVVARKTDHLQAIRKVFDSQQVWQVQNFVREQTGALRNTQDIPADLDENIFPAIRSMLERSGANQSYFYSSVFDLYRESKDFRILEAIADSMLGQSNNNAYAALEVVRQRTKEVRDEATADSILERIAKLRNESDSAVDRHVLDLFEVLVELRNSTLEDQAETHIAKAQAALQRAAKLDWAPGQRPLMAKYLRQLAVINGEPMMAERIKQLDALLAAEIADPASKQTPLDRLKIATNLGQTLRKYDRPADVVARLTPELNQYLETPGTAFANAHNAIGTVVWAHVDMDHFMAAETQLQDLIVDLEDKDNAESKAFAANRNQWLHEQLNELYLDCFREKGSVSLGSGEALYKALQDRLLKQFTAESLVPIEDQRHTLLRKLNELYQLAVSTIPQAKTDQQKFALEIAPPIVNKMANRYADSVQALTSSLKHTKQSTIAVECFLDFFENQPTWSRRSGKLDIDYLTGIVDKLKEKKNQAKRMPQELEERLVKVVVADLKYRLTHLAQQMPDFTRRHRYMLKGYEMRFRNAALEVWEENSKSNNHARRISDYLFYDLRQQAESVALLTEAYDDGILTPANSYHLVDQLTHLKRYRPAIKILVERIEADPKNLTDHTRLVVSYHKVGQQDKAKEALQAADTIFKFDNLPEDQLALVAQACQRASFHTEAVNYFQWLTQRRRLATAGRADRPLEGYYIQLSSAHLALGDLESALEAANAAIVIWGADRKYNSDSLSHLKRLVRAVDKGEFDTNLDDWVKQLDQESEKTGQYNYVLRNFIAQKYLQNAKYDAAIKQFQLAIELMPNDAQMHKHLIECYQKSRDREAEILQRVELVKLDRRSVANYQQLGGRLKELAIADAESAAGKEFASQAERAFTSMVEMLPTETEGHIALAEVRATQKRWDDSIQHWQRVNTIRSKEPTGLLGLCDVQIDAGQIAQAKATIRKLKQRSWPTRFNNLSNQIRDLEKRLK